MPNENPLKSYPSLELDVVQKDRFLDSPLKELCDRQQEEIEFLRDLTGKLLALVNTNNIEAVVEEADPKRLPPRVTGRPGFFARREELERKSKMDAIKLRNQETPLAEEPTNG